MFFSKIFNFIYAHLNPPYIYLSECGISPYKAYDTYIYIRAYKSIHIYNPSIWAMHSNLYIPLVMVQTYIYPCLMDMPIYCLWLCKCSYMVCGPGITVMMDLTMYIIGVMCGLVSGFIIGVGL